MSRKNKEKMVKKKRMLGIAKRNIKAGEEVSFPINLSTGELLPNNSINFIEGTTVAVLLKKENQNI